MQCRPSLAGPPRPVREIAGAPPQHLDLLADQVWALAPYDGVVRRLVVNWKESGRVDLTDLLAAGMACSLTPFVLQASAEGYEPLLVPVPSAPSAVRDRGADLVALATRRAAARLFARGHRVRVGSVLRHSAKVRDQAGLDQFERAANVAGRFVARREVRGEVVVILDDVVTTGATAAEAARVLSRAGAQVLGVAAVAATVKRHITPTVGV